MALPVEKMEGKYIMANIECTAYIERLQDEFDEIRDDVTLLLSGYAFYIVDSSDEEKNQDIITQINNLLNSKLEEKKEFIRYTGKNTISRMER